MLSSGRSIAVILHKVEHFPDTGVKRKDGITDIVLWRRPPILEPKHQHLLEVKHLKKRDAAQLAETAEEGRAQLRRYLTHPDIARRGDVLGWLLVVVGYEVLVAERVDGAGQTHGR